MKISFEFTEQEISLVQKVIIDRKERKFVQYRWQNNVDKSLPKTNPNDEHLWMTMVMCLLTTQQRSGPNSPINQLLDTRPFPLSLNVCRRDSLQRYVFQLLTDAKGIRRTNKIAKAIEANLARLDTGEWQTLFEWRDKLMVQRQSTPTPSHRILEEQASDYMVSFLEFGPKQARNFWQSLGLTRYVFVLDSRILKWLRDNLNIEKGLLTTQGLGDSNYYSFVSNIISDICQRADVLPCMFDAAVFDSFDEGTEWNQELII